MEPGACVRSFLCHLGVLLWHRPWCQHNKIPPIRAQYLERSGPMRVLHSDCCYCRFTPSAAHPPWAGILQAISYGPACPQQFPQSLNNKTESLKRMTRQILSVQR